MVIHIYLEEEEKWELKHSRNESGPHETALNLECKINNKMNLTCIKTLPLMTKGWSCKSIPGGSTNKSGTISSSWTYPIHETVQSSTKTNIEAIPSKK